MQQGLREGSAACCEGSSLGISQHSHQIDLRLPQHRGRAAALALRHIYSGSAAGDKLCCPSGSSLVFLTPEAASDLWCMRSGSARLRQAFKAVLQLVQSGNAPHVRM